MLTAGMVLAYAGAARDLDVTWIPAYGAAMRGGTANCTVKLSNDEIASPFPKHQDVLIAMNEPSLLKFQGSVKEGGSIIVNSSIVQHIPEIPNRKVYAVRANAIAEEYKNERSANLCALGAAVAAAEDLVSIEDVVEGLKNYFSKVKNNESNIAVLRAGYHEVKRLKEREEI